MAVSGCQPAIGQVSKAQLPSAQV